ncbi:MAG: azurin [Neisseriaceae bacterium]|nr:azurin [Neisseriaceae bacterium]MBR3425450.1 azurin [Neisseriaceae bacterium]
MCCKKVLLVLMCSLASSVWAADSCTIDIKGTDLITFTDMAGKPLRRITVPAKCNQFTINMFHVGKMPKTAMGHNVVITKTADISGVIKDGMRYGISKDYLPPKDPRIIAASTMIGGGAKTSVQFPVAKIKNGDYSFFCSFIGHDRKMRGKFEIQ